MNPAAVFLRSCRQRCSRPQLACRTTSQSLLSSTHLCTSRTVSTQVEGMPEESIASLIAELPSSAREDASPPPPASSPSSKPSESTNTTVAEQDFIKSSFKKIGTVTRAGTMKNTVVVSSNRQQFDSYLKKHYARPTSTFVHDPKDTLVEGDVITFGVFPPDQMADRAKRGKRSIRFVLRDVVTPFGLPLDQRTPRVTIPNPAKGTVTFGGSTKQRKRAGVRNFTTTSRRQVDQYSDSTSTTLSPSSGSDAS